MVSVEVGAVSDEVSGNHHIIVVIVKLFCPQPCVLC